MNQHSQPWRKESNRLYFVGTRSKSRTFARDLSKCKEFGHILQCKKKYLSFIVRSSTEKNDQPKSTIKDYQVMAEEKRIEGKSETSSTDIAAGNNQIISRMRCAKVQNIVSSAVSSAFNASALSRKNFHNYSSIIQFDY